MRARVFCNALFLLLIACSGKRNPPDAAVAASNRPLRNMMPAQSIVSASAVDIAATAGGALVVFVTADPQLRVVRVSETGSPIEGPITLRTDASLASARELVVAAGSGRWGAAWIEHDAQDAQSERVHAVWGSLASLGTVQHQVLGKTVPSQDATRARLALFANDAGELQSLFRTTPYDCTASQGVCARYAHRRLGAAEPSAAGLDTMEIAAPCEPMIAGAVTSHGTWFYSVCSAEPELAAHVFSLRPEISYAAVHQGATGYAPRALVPTDDGAWSITAAQGRVNVDVLMADAHGEQRIYDARTELACAPDGSARLAVTGTGATEQPASASAALVGVRSRLEGALPQGLARPGARAVWTGRALLVLHPETGTFSMHRWRCAMGGQGAIFE